MSGRRCPFVRNQTHRRCVLREKAAGRTDPLEQSQSHQKLDLVLPPKAVGRWRLEKWWSQGYLPAGQAIQKAEPPRWWDIPLWDQVRCQSTAMEAHCWRTWTAVCEGEVQQFRLLTIRWLVTQFFTWITGHKQLICPFPREMRWHLISWCTVHLKHRWILAAEPTNQSTPKTIRVFMSNRCCCSSVD